MVSVTRHSIALTSPTVTQRSTRRVVRKAATIVPSFVKAEVVVPWTPPVVPPADPSTGSPPVVRSATPLRVVLGELVIPAASSITLGLYGDAGASYQLPSVFREQEQMGLFTKVSTLQEGQGESPAWVVVTKMEGPFRIQITNPDANRASPQLEVRIRYSHSIER
jgi:hypothetical protein